MPKDITKRVLDKVIFIKDTLQSFMKKLESKNIWSLRIGDYKTLIDIFEDKKLMEVVKVGHRKEVYDDI